MTTVPRYFRYVAADENVAPANRCMIQMRFYEKRNGKSFWVTHFDFTGPDFETCQAKVDAFWEAEMERAGKLERAKVARLVARSQSPSVHSEGAGTA